MTNPITEANLLWHINATRLELKVHYGESSNAIKRIDYIENCVADLIDLISLKSKIFVLKEKYEKALKESDAYDERDYDYEAKIEVLNELLGDDKE